MTTVLPIIVLSIVPHQEPRFLLPILPAVILMTAHKLRARIFGYKPLLTLWYIFNIFATLWFGFLHQSGVVPIQRHISSLDHGDAMVNLVYSHTYMPPRYPLLQPLAKTDSVPAYCYNPRARFMVHDMGGADLREVQSKLLVLYSRSKYMGKRHNKMMTTYLVMPSHLHR